MRSSIHNKATARTCVLTACAFMLLACVGAANAQVLKVNSKQYYGKTYNEWVVAYWQWAMSIPFSTNPWANDPTGANSGLGQSGPVWFLGGTLGDSVTRSVTIPSGKAIFLPVNQVILDRNRRVRSSRPGRHVSRCYTSNLTP